MGLGFHPPPEQPKTLSFCLLSVCLFVCLSVTASRLGMSEFVRTVSCVLWISILPVVNNRLRG